MHNCFVACAHACVCVRIRICQLLISAVRCNVQRGPLRRQPIAGAPPQTAYRSQYDNRMQRYQKQSCSMSILCTVVSSFGIKLEVAHVRLLPVTAVANSSPQRYQRYVTWSYIVIMHFDTLLRGTPDFSVAAYPCLPQCAHRFNVSPCQLNMHNLLERIQGYK